MVDLGPIRKVCFHACLAHNLEVHSYLNNGIFHHLSVFFCLLL
jgi:hypothetical protein